MALTFTRLFVPTVLATAAGIVYTAPAAPATTLLKNGLVRFTNTSAGAVAVTAYAAPAGLGPLASNCFMNAVSIGPNDFLDVSLPELAAGDTFQAFASAATSITCLALDGVLYS